jgi:hypothetical protein
MCRRISVQRCLCCSVGLMVPRSITLDAANCSARRPWKTISRPTSSLKVPNSSPYTQLHILSMSSQSVTIPCSMGYLIFRRPLYSCALRPMKTSPSRAPAMTRTCFGRPTLCTCIQGRTDVDRWKAKVTRRRRGPNRENAQRREEAFWVILTSKTGFYRSRSLLKRNAKRSSAPVLWQAGVGEGVCSRAYVVDDDWLVG